MPRPCRQRRICALPRCGRFGPTQQTASPPIQMTVDEFECIRLIDWEGLTQEQCAEQMQVARTTVQAIYSSARRKLAACLVDARSLVIAGGDYALCGAQEQENGCPSRGCSCPKQQRKKENTMKIAVTYENGQVFQHFGHSEQFKLYEVKDGAVANAEVVGTNGSGHGALADLLRGMGVDTLICGGIGGGARQALDTAGIQLYPGVSGVADDAVAALLAGTLSFNPDERCAHHEHEHGQTGGCGSHGCGSEDHHCSH